MLFFSALVGLVATDADPNTPGIQLPTTLGGTTAEVNGQRAGLFFVSPAQINFAIPASVSAGEATITVRAGNGEVSQTTVRVLPTAPAIFAINSVVTSVSGFFKDTTGNKLQGVTVRVRDAIKSAVTNQEGSFVIYDLVAGNAEIEVDGGTASPLPFPKTSIFTP